MSERMSISRQSLVGRSGKTTFRSPTDAGKGGFLALAQPCRVNEGNLAQKKSEGRLGGVLHIYLLQLLRLSLSDLVRNAPLLYHQDIRPQYVLSIYIDSDHGPLTATGSDHTKTCRIGDDSVFTFGTGN
jgi:hypothetical protein